MPVDANRIGSRGEAIVTLSLTEQHDRPFPWFRPNFLGERWPTVDFIVELVGSTGNEAPFFLAQVKSTSLGYTTSNRLKVQMRRNHMAALIKYPVPTYVIGVDEVNRRSFIMAALAGDASHFRSLPTFYSLEDRTILESLYDEVQTFWAIQANAFAMSRFV